MSHPTPEAVSEDQSTESNLEYLIGQLSVAAPYIVALAALGAAAWTMAEGPKWAKVFVLASAGSFVVAYPIVSRITAWLWSPETIYLLVVDAADLDGGIELHELTENEWAELAVENNAKLEQVPAQVPLYVCRTFDAEAMSCIATWRGSVDDLELLRREAAITDMRERLEPMADNYNALRAKFPTVVRQAQTELLVHILETIERESMPNGERITSIINGAIPNDLAQIIDEGKDVDESKIEDGAHSSEQSELEENPDAMTATLDLDAAVEDGVTQPAGGTDD